jgi:hypothetical protein
MKLRHVAVGVITAALLAGCGHSGTVTPVGQTIPPATIQSVATKIGCDSYQKDPTIAPGSIESGSCELLGGLVTAQLYQMPSRDSGAYLVSIAHSSGVAAKDITWYGNVLVVTDAP